MKKLRVALVSGGLSSEREVSLMGGRKVLEALDPERYIVTRYDPKTDLARLTEDAPHIDVALLILHGPYGEDGTIQGFLDLLGVPYQGSGVLGSALAMDKLATKQIYDHHGIPTPAYAAFQKDRADGLDEAAASLGFPLVIKPCSSGSSVGMSIVSGPEFLDRALEKAFAEDGLILLEKYIQGTEITGAVLGNDEITALPIVEILPGPGHAFFDYEAKYVPGATEEICPARISPELTQKAQALALASHRALRCRGVSRTDFMLEGQTLWVLETNTIPGMTPTSLLPQAAAAAGLPFPKLLDRLIELALEDAGKTL